MKTQKERSLDHDTKEEFEKAKTDAQTLYDYGCISGEELPLLNAAIDDHFFEDEPPFPHTIAVVAAAILGRAHRMCQLQEVDGSPRGNDEWMMEGKQLPRMEVKELQRIAQMDLLDYFYY